MSSIIEVKNLSKKYLISHKVSGYATLVDALSAKAKQYVRKIRHPFTHQPQTNEEVFWALKDINFSVTEGDRVGILGRNGAGKSTLLKILSRITAPTTGQVRIRGRVSSLLEVGTGFHPELTGRENIFLNGAILGMRRQEILSKFDEIVAFAEVEKFLDTPVKRFSSGMYTRLGFAIAAHLESDVLIIDEVLAVGDAKFQEKCLKKLGHLSNNGRTVLFVSHNVGSLLALCNKGILLNQGTIQIAGPIDQCVNAYVQHNSVQGITWTGNEGDDQVRFSHAALSVPNMQREFFYKGEEVDLGLEFETAQKIQGLTFVLAVMDQRGQVLARAHTWDNPGQLTAFTQAGKHRLSFKLDTSLFHEGEYVLRISSSIHNKKRILHDEIGLKLSVYARERNLEMAHSDHSGICLGNQWKIDPLI